MIDGCLFTVSGKSWRLIPAPRKNVKGVQWLILDSTGRRCTCLFMTPNGRIGTRWELELRYKSQTMWTKRKQRAYRRHKIIEKLDGPTDFSWVVEHENYVPKKRRRMRASTYRRLRKRLVTTPKARPAQNQLKDRHAIGVKGRRYAAANWRFGPETDSRVATKTPSQSINKRFRLVVNANHTFQAFQRADKLM